MSFGVMFEYADGVDELGLVDPLAELPQRDLSFPGRADHERYAWLSNISNLFAENPELAMENAMHNFGDMVGSPETDVMYWQPQTTEFTCAVQAQRGIIEMFTGEDISEAELVYEATSFGWLNDGGMSPTDVGKLLELHGVSCHTRFNANIEELMAELASGHKVIIGVDGGELWGEDGPLEDFFQESADHAVWVTGVDRENGLVTINDSGDPNGAGKVYDLRLFVDAWADSNFNYIATDEAPPDFSNEIAGFNNDLSIFEELVAWIADCVGGAWDSLDLGVATTGIINRSPMVSGIAGILTETFSLGNSVMDLTDDADINMVFRLL